MINNIVDDAVICYTDAKTISALQLFVTNRSWIVSKFVNSFPYFGVIGLIDFFKRVDGRCPLGYKISHYFAFLLASIILKASSIGIEGSLDFLASS